MGADGHIKIWRDEVVRAAFPDCDELFRCFPSHYVDTLDLVKYHHCYWGDNIWVSYHSEDDWYTDFYPTADWSDEKLAEETAKRDALIARLREFYLWLESNGTHWEVWT